MLVYTLEVLKMIRTQIYLTEQQRFALSRLSSQSGKNQSELIREAVDRMIAKLGQTRRQVVLSQTAGMWKDREDLPDADKLRKDWDRELSS